MSQYDADPRAEELQLLRQLLRAQPSLGTTHSATIAVLDRLVMKGEAMSWPWPDGPGYIFEITATGIKSLPPIGFDRALIAGAFEAIAPLERHDGGRWVTLAMSEEVRDRVVQILRDGR